MKEGESFQIASFKSHPLLGSFTVREVMHE